ELVNPIISQQHLQLMQLNTRLLLEQAQISLLKEESVSYKESLKAASSLVNQYYFESPKRAAFSEDIIALAQKDIAPTLPDISKSLKLLHSYIADQHRLNAPSAGQINGEGAQ
ncbi:MAG TPA: uroporphyrinogen-III C-methyltransferase, partial [Marinagarivorans sp.]